MLSLITNTASEVASAALGQNQEAEGISIQQLSSGKRIVQASIDPAGLAVALEMSGLLGSLTQASTNAQNANGMLQTADGALSNIGNALTTMQQLANEAADGTINDTQRQALNTQFKALYNEINNIASSTQFNGIKLLQSISPVQFQVGATNTSADQLQVTLPNISAAGLLNLAASSSLALGTTIFTSGASQNLNISDPQSKFSLIAPGTGNAADAALANTVAATAPATPGDKLAAASPNQITLTVTKVNGGDVTFQVGDSSGGTGAYITVGTTNGTYVENLDGTGLDFQFSNVSGYSVGQSIVLSFGGAATSADISTQTNAQSMVTATTNALSTLAGDRGSVGAYEQQLNTISSNLSSEQQTLSAALSNVQDANIAQTYAEFTQQTVLSQAAVSVLKQANAIPQQLATLFQ